MMSHIFPFPEFDTVSVEYLKWWHIFSHIQGLTLRQMMTYTQLQKKRTTYMQFPLSKTLTGDSYIICWYIGLKFVCYFLTNKIAFE